MDIFILMRGEMEDRLCFILRKVFLIMEKGLKCLLKNERVGIFNIFIFIVYFNK